MYRILFVCHGNICRSTMAEYVMKELVRRSGRSSEFEIDSAATSLEEIGNPIYPPARRKLDKEGIPVGDHRARRITKQDYEHFDKIYIMDSNNQRNILRVLGSDPGNKIEYLVPRNVADPWYTGDFDATYRDVMEGCLRILEETKEK